LHAATLHADVTKIIFQEIKKYMKMPFKYKDTHHCEAAVLSCIDFRFWKETVSFVENELGIESFDFPSLPGSAKAINESEKNGLAMSCISIPIELHHAKKVIIVNHEDCGAYGGSEKFGEDRMEEQKFHEGELKKAKGKILEKYPEHEVILIYARLDNDKENIDFIIIE
jgi:carbonic anhydrase